MKNIFLQISYRIWRTEVARIILMAYQTGHINSEQLHTLMAAFDRTQKAHYQVGRKDFYPWHSRSGAAMKGADHGD